MIIDDPVYDPDIHPTPEEQVAEARGPVTARSLPTIHDPNLMIGEVPVTRKEYLEESTTPQPTIPDAVSFQPAGIADPNGPVMLHEHQELGKEYYSEPKTPPPQDPYEQNARLSYVIVPPVSQDPERFAKLLHYTQHGLTQPSVEAQVGRLISAGLLANKELWRTRGQWTVAQTVYRRLKEPAWLARYWPTIVFLRGPMLGNIRTEAMMAASWALLDRVGELCRER